MNRSSALRALLFALPGLVIAVVGLFHPAHLTAESAHTWLVVHVIGAPAFPLLGLPLWLLVRGRGALGWVVLFCVYVYGICYGALDLLAGVANGAVSVDVPDAGDRPGVLSAVFVIGDKFAFFGVWAFLLACALVAADQVLRHRLWAVPPSVLLVVAAVSFLDSHIYPWRGVVTLVAIGVASGWLALRREGGRDGQST